MVYVPGTSNVVADALSCPTTARVCATIADRASLDLKDMALCPQVQALRSSPDCASSHSRSATLTSSATHPPAHSARWCPGTFGDRFSNISMGPPTRDRPPGPPGDLPTHLLQVCMERALNRCHHLGEGLPGLPVSQGPPPCTGTATTHPGTHPQFQPHQRGHRGPPAGIQRFYLPVHHH
jgi:hypothetical protein